MAIYGETAMRGNLPNTTFGSAQLTGDKPTYKCDQCVAPSVAVVRIGEGKSTLTLEFCGHHLAEHTAKLSDRGHQVVFHE